MPSYLLRDGDEVRFFPEFLGITVSVRPGFIKGTGKAKQGSLPICVEGDEKSVIVTACPYVNKVEGYTGGTGTLKISKLKQAHISQKTKIATKAVLLNGNRIPFAAEFQVEVGGFNQVAQTTDASGRIYSQGQGYFETKNAKNKSN